MLLRREIEQMTSVIMTAAVALAAIAPAAAQPVATTEPQTSKPIGPYSPFVEAGELIFLSGQIALDPSTGKLDPGSSIETQTAIVWANIERVLSSAGLTLKDVVQANVYLTDMNEFGRMNVAYAKALGEIRPARTTIGVQALPLGARIEIAVIARRTDSH